MKPACVILLLASATVTAPALAGPAAAEAVAQAGNPADATEAEETAPTQRARPAARPTLRTGVDDLLLEAGALPDAPEASALGTLRASAFVLWQPSRTWEFRAGARVDGQAQAGGTVDDTRWSADLTETYARWRHAETRLTFGAQTIVWGRVDALPLVDRVSRVDLTRFVLDDLPDRRRAQLAARWEQNWDDFKLDAVFLPVFRGAELPSVDSVWSPVNRSSGRVIGLPASPELAAFVRNAQIDEDDGGSGGGALRLTHAGEPFDFGLTLARTRQSLPYYRADPNALRLTIVHPYNNFAGVDAEWVSGALTWRLEAGYTDGVPVTLPNAEMAMASAREAIGALEFFPGGKDTRVNLQIVLRSLQADQPFLEIDDYAGVNGEIETSFGQGRWKAGLRFSSGLNVHDTYLGPRLTFVGWEPHEIYIAGHWFDGETRSLGGFHQDHAYIAIGVQTRF
ncbi:MAG: hypothetical protein IPQ21_13455 [Betaproteobacteria bacterium]|nr:hypothetical protein [Betaproteobacteria bacterium]